MLIKGNHFILYLNKLSQTSALRFFHIARVLFLIPFVQQFSFFPFFILYGHVIPPMALSLKCVHLFGNIFYVLPPFLSILLPLVSVFTSQCHVFKLFFSFSFLFYVFYNSYGRDGVTSQKSISLRVFYTNQKSRIKK